MSSSVCRAVAVPHCGTSPQPVRGVTGMRGARCSRVLTEFHMTPSPLSVAARPRCSPAFALLLRPDSRGTMLDLCYSEKCISTMGAANNWDDCGLDDTCGACPARFRMRPSEPIDLAYHVHWHRAPGGQTTQLGVSDGFCAHSKLTSRRRILQRMQRKELAPVELRWQRREILQLTQSCVRCRAHAAQQRLRIAPG